MPRLYLVILFKSMVEKNEHLNIDKNFDHQMSLNRVNVGIVFDWDG